MTGDSVGVSKVAVAALVGFAVAVGGVVVFLAPALAVAAPRGWAGRFAGVAPTTPSPTCLPLCLPKPTTAPPTHQPTAPPTHRPTAVPTTHPAAPPAPTHVATPPAPADTGGAVGTQTGPTDLPSIQLGAPQRGLSASVNPSTGRAAADSKDPLVRDLVLVLGFGVLLGLGGAAGLYLTRSRPAAEITR